MNAAKLTLTLLCWASALPAMEERAAIKKNKLELANSINSEKEISVYEHEQAMELNKLAKAQKAAAIDAHNQENPLLQLPNEMLDHIAQSLINNVTHAQSEKELQESVQAIARFKRSCHKFNNLLQSKFYQEMFKQNLNTALTKIKAGADLKDDEWMDSMYACCS